MRRLGIIGYGHMGRAIVGGLRRDTEGLELGVVEKAPARLEEARADGAENFTDRISDLAEWAEVVVLAIKPQDLTAFAESAGSGLSEASLVSILAGTRMQSIGSLLKPRRLCRFMPNLAALIGEAGVGVSFAADSGDEEFRANALAVAEAIGTPVEVREELLAAITGVSGSGLAYAFRFIHGLALGGTLEGLTYEQALETAIQMVSGAAALLKQGGEHPEAMLSKVTSPGGTTIAGVKELEEGAFTDAVMNAVSAAARRARQME